MEDFEKIPDGSAIFAESLKKAPLERLPDFAPKKGTKKGNGGIDSRKKRTVI